MSSAPLYGHPRARRSALHTCSKQTSAAVRLQRAFAPTSSDAVLKRGFLCKKGHLLPSHKQRWVELRPQLLCYFRVPKSAQHAAETEGHMLDASRMEMQLKGAIPLTPEDVVAPMAAPLWFIIHKSHGLHGRAYKLELRATSEQERQEWLAALRQACQVLVPAVQLLAHEGELERTLASSMSILRARDPTLVSAHLRDQALRASQLDKNISEANLRASFQIFHELVLLQSLLRTIQATWGPPAQWTLEQYDELVRSIELAQTNASPLAALDSTGTLGQAQTLRHAFEEVAENQQNLIARNQTEAKSDPAVLIVGDTPPGRQRCPTIYSYLATFEALSSDALATNSAGSSRTNSSDSMSKSSTPSVLSPRTATIAKYAHMYLEEEGRQRKVWSWERVIGDDVFDQDAQTEDEMTRDLIARAENAQIYTALRHHTLLFVNPLRLLKTVKFTSMYNEQLVQAYSQTPFASSHMAPHPFGLTKQGLFRLFFAQDAAIQHVMLLGESGSGKTEVSKEMLKYVVLTAQPAHGTRLPRVVVYTSSTKSTFQMRSDETKTLALLEALGVMQFELVLLDIYPQRWDEMTRVSCSKRLPQIHIDGLFFGFYETLQRLQDEEQLRLYLQNPRVARKLSSVLDSNVLLEAFGHTATVNNLNSSRYGKTTELSLCFGPDASSFQVLGCRLTPFLLEKTRVTSVKQHMHDFNFHVLYALVHGVNAGDRAMAEILHLHGAKCEEFAYLGRRPHVVQVGASSARDLGEKDIERFGNILMAFDTLGVSQDQQEAVFRVLSAILWLGNMTFRVDTKTDRVDFDESGDLNRSLAAMIVDLLQLDTIDTLRAMLFQRKIAMASTGEQFELSLGLSQIAHVRDTLARLLYELMFRHIVDVMNAVTMIAPDDNSVKRSVRLLRILDAFGFEDLDRNSLEQLCINYLSEKAVAIEAQWLAQAYASSEPIAVSSLSDTTPLFLFEHPLGIFASLQEQTMLHQSDADADSLSGQQKNGVFVRYVTQRNPVLALTQTQQMSMDNLGFQVPHTRATVIYDARDFVNKNSDFRFPALMDGLAASKNRWIRQIAQPKQDETRATTASAADGGSTGSLLTQWRSEIQQHFVESARESSLLPLVVHCFRPNDRGWNPDVDQACIERQVHAHGIHRALRICEDASAYYEIKMDTTVFSRRYRCLLPAAEGIEQQVQAVRQLLGVGSSDVRIDGSVVCFRQQELVERLELALKQQEMRAATQIQAITRMWLARELFQGQQRERKLMEKELLQIYGEQSNVKVERTLRKYLGREDELKTKIANKLRERQSEQALEAALQDYLADGLDAQMLQLVLQDAKLQALIGENDSIVAALRELSLNPRALGTQLRDPILRAFYEQMHLLLQAQMSPPDTASTEHSLSREAEDMSMEKRIRVCIAQHKTQWLRLAKTPRWEPHVDCLEEVGEDPEMLLFYQDDAQVQAILAEFVFAVEQDAAAASDETRHIDLLDKLQHLELDASLLAAMQNDAFFARALLDPVLISALHELMVDRNAFRSQSAMNPTVRTFLEHLVQLADTKADAPSN